MFGTFFFLVKLEVSLYSGRGRVKTQATKDIEPQSHSASFMLAATLFDYTSERSSTVFACLVGVIR